jgi:hypothetical protein
VIPGPSAVLAALAVSGLPTDRFSFEGFLPRKAGDRRKTFEGLRAEPRTMIFFESPHRIHESLAAAAEVLGRDRRASVSRELTKKFEQTVRGTLAELTEWAAEEPRGEIVLVVAGAEPATTDSQDLLALVLQLAADGTRLLKIKEELGVEILDTFNSQAFAVVDHQVAHVIVQDRSKLDEVRKILENTDGVEKVLDQEAQKKLGINHVRSGDFIVIAKKNVWFSYYWWMNDERAPDYARTVDIHRKPGYDPAELLIDSAIKLPLMNIVWFLLKKRLGFRALLKLTPLTGEKIKGSHGRVPEDSLDWPVIISSQPSAFKRDCTSTEVHQTIISGF